MKKFYIEHLFVYNIFMLCVCVAYKKVHSQIGTIKRTYIQRIMNHVIFENKSS